MKRVFIGSILILTAVIANHPVAAAIIGRADTFQNADQVIIISIPASYFQPEIVVVAVLATTTQPEAAILLQQFLCSPQAVETFKGFGFLSLEKYTHQT